MNEHEAKMRARRIVLRNAGLSESEIDEVLEEKASPVDEAIERELDAAAAPGVVMPPHEDAMERLSEEEKARLFATLPEAPELDRDKAFNVALGRVEDCAQAALEIAREVRERAPEESIGESWAQALQALKYRMTLAINACRAYDREMSKLRKAELRAIGQEQRDQFVKDIVDEIAREGVYPTRKRVATGMGRRALSPREDRIRQLQVKMRYDEGWVKPPHMSEREVREKIRDLESLREAMRGRDVDEDDRGNS